MPSLLFCDVHTKLVKFGHWSHHMFLVSKCVIVYTSMDKCCDKMQFWHCIPLGISWLSTKLLCGRLPVWISGQTNTQGFLSTEEKVLPLSNCEAFKSSCTRTIKCRSSLITFWFCWCCGTAWHLYLRKAYGVWGYQCIKYNSHKSRSCYVLEWMKRMWVYEMLMMFLSNQPEICFGFFVSDEWEEPWSLLCPITLSFVWHEGRSIFS